MEKLTLNTLSCRGQIYIGGGVAKKYLPSLTHGQKNFVLTDENVYGLYQAFFGEYFSEAEIFVMKAGEEYKTIRTLESVFQKMAGAGLKRTARLFAVGGGVVGDLGGLAAALYMRGISCVQIPTTLLAQLDSSVGGKTAIDFGGVKNLIGAFYQPQTVLVDFDFLTTLPAREWKCGLGELVKYAALNGEIFEKLYAGKNKLCDGQFLASLIGECIRCKASVVERDEKESLERKCLNIGHTTGHALELIYGLSHGEGVLYGMKAETQIAINAGVCEKEYGEALLELVDAALSVAPKTELDGERLAEAVTVAKLDKKNGEDGNIALSVAKAKGEWTLFSMTEKAYQIAIKEILGK